MKVDKNITLDELLELWVKYSHMFFHEEKVTQEDLETFRQINKFIENHSIDNVQILNVRKNCYTIRYFRNGGDFKKEIKL